MRRDPVTGQQRWAGAHPAGAKRIRGGSGLGDALYIRPIAEHFVRRGDPVTVCSDYPDVFRGTGAAVQPFVRERINVLAHYTAGKQNPATTQWEDVQRSAGVHDIPLAFTWGVGNLDLVDLVQKLAAGRPVILVHGGRPPMAREDRFGAELLPDRRAMKAAIDSLSGCFTVRIGAGPETYPIPAELDLSGKTTVADVIDLGRTCDGIVSQVGFTVPLAEVFDRPLLVVWAERGLSSRHPYISTITPRKILAKPATSSAVLDSASPEEIAAAVESFHGRALCAS